MQGEFSSCIFYIGNKCFGIPPPFFYFAKDLHTIYGKSHEKGAFAVKQYHAADLKPSADRKNNADIKNSAGQASKTNHEQNAPAGIENAKRRLKIGVVTNGILLLLILAVLLVGMIPERIAPIFQTEKYAVYYAGDKSGNKASLMFNVYEGEPEVERILEILERRGVKATFFFGGCFVASHEEIVKKVALSGHEIANHGYFHKDHAKLSLEENLREIRAAEAVISSACGIRTTLFAPPSGAYSETTLKAAKQLGYLTVLWTKDTIDWRDSDPAVVLNRIKKKPEAGDLVLMHPKKVTVSVLNEIISCYTARGISLVPVSENIIG